MSSRPSGPLLGNGPSLKDTDMARLDDVLEVITRCAETRAASLTLVQEVRRDGVVLVRAKVLVVLVSEAGKPQRLGQLVRGALERFVNQAC